MTIDKHILNHFLSLLRAGLWERSAGIPADVPLDFGAIFKLADEQSVLGLVTAGLEHLEGRKVEKSALRDFLEAVVYLEKRNPSMDAFVAELFRRLNGEGIQAVLVKGQGVAQCYERPHWRMSGDVDLLLDEENYQKAKAFLVPQAENVHEQPNDRLHLGMHIGPWSVELHGTLRTSMSARVNEVIDSVQRDTLACYQVRYWRDCGIDIQLPEPTNDAIFIFTHFLNHFFVSGLGVRQVCDWCRLLWTFRETIDTERLEGYVRQMGLVSEWKAFATYAVDYLGMPAEAMPLYDPAARWSRKARRLNAFMLKTGNFGHNRGKGRLMKKYPYLVYKAIALGIHVGDFFRRLPIFPADACRMFWKTLVGGVGAVMEGK